MVERGIHNNEAHTRIPLTIGLNSSVQELYKTYLIVKEKAPKVTLDDKELPPSYYEQLVFARVTAMVDREKAKPLIKDLIVRIYKNIPDYEESRPLSPLDKIDQYLMISSIFPLDDNLVEDKEDPLPGLTLRTAWKHAIEEQEDPFLRISDRLSYAHWVGTEEEKQASHDEEIHSLMQTVKAPGKDKIAINLPYLACISEQLQNTNNQTSENEINAYIKELYDTKEILKFKPESIGATFFLLPKISGSEKTAGEVVDTTVEAFRDRIDSSSDIFRKDQPDREQENFDYEKIAGDACKYYLKHGHVGKVIQFWQTMTDEDESGYILHSLQKYALDNRDFTLLNNVEQSYREKFYEPNRRFNFAESQIKSIYSNYVIYKNIEGKIDEVPLIPKIKEAMRKLGGNRLNYIGDAITELPDEHEGNIFARELLKQYLEKAESGELSEHITLALLETLVNIKTKEKQNN